MATVLGKYRYFRFETVASRSGSLSDYLYTGQEFDSETGLHNYRARMMSGTDELGRFFSMDPQHQTHSPYSYAGNNPISNVDPDGELFWVLPSISYSYRDGLSLGVTGGVGVPGGFGASLNVGYNFKNEQASWSAGVYAGPAYGNYGSSGFNTGVGYNQNNSGFGFNIAGVNYNARGGLTTSVLGAEYNRNTGWAFNPGISYSQRFEWGKGANPNQIQLDSRAARMTEKEFEGDVLRGNEYDLSELSKTEKQKLVDLADAEDFKTDDFGVRNITTETGSTRLNPIGLTEDGFYVVQKENGSYAIAKGMHIKTTHSVHISPNLVRNASTGLSGYSTFLGTLRHEFVHAYHFQKFGYAMDTDKSHFYADAQNAFTYREFGINSSYLYYMVRASFMPYDPKYALPSGYNWAR